jgi:hypothetical protein
MKVTIQPSIQDTLLELLTLNPGDTQSIKVGKNIINKRTGLPIQRNQVKDMSFLVKSDASDQQVVTIALDPGNLPSNFKVDSVTTPGFTITTPNVGTTWSYDNSWYTITLPTGISQV